MQRLTLDAAAVFPIAAMVFALALAVFSFSLSANLTAALHANRMQRYSESHRRTEAVRVWFIPIMLLAMLALVFTASVGWSAADQLGEPAMDWITGLPAPSHHLLLAGGSAAALAALSFAVAYLRPEHAAIRRFPHRAGVTLTLFAGALLALAPLVWAMRPMVLDA